MLAESGVELGESDVGDSVIRFGVEGGAVVFDGTVWVSVFFGVESQIGPGSGVLGADFHGVMKELEGFVGVASLMEEHSEIE